MAVFYGLYTGARTTVPPSQIDGGVQGARVRVYREKITLATQTTSDTIVIAYPSIRESFLFGQHATSVTLGSSTIAVGVTGTVAKYKAAATFTTTLTPTVWGAVAAITDFDPLTAGQEVFITIAAASLPAAGTYFTDMFFCAT
jgi:hypothetical protein